MGQVLEWPEIVTEGDTIEDCQANVLDAIREMVKAHQSEGLEIPFREVQTTNIDLDLTNVS